MKKYIILFLVLLTIITSAQAVRYTSSNNITPSDPPSGMYEINLNNATSCRVKIEQLAVVAKETTEPTDIYSFYYQPPAYQKITYYSTIPVGQSATVVVGTGSPYQTPTPYDDLELRATSAGLYGPGVTYFGTNLGDFRAFNNAYIVLFYQDQTACTQDKPCLMCFMQNPCTTSAPVKMCGQSDSGIRRFYH